MIYHCCEALRRNATAAHPTLNGLDYLEVLDRDLPPGHPFRQRLLLLRFIKPIAGLDRTNLRLTGGDRIAARIDWAEPAQPVPAALTPEEAAILGALPQADRERILAIRTDSDGDHSTYRLQLVRSPVDDRVPAGYDPQLGEIDFTFKAECPSDFDCRPARECEATDAPPPEINYLAKDYGSFRRLLLDRMRHLVPGWRASSPADVGVTLAELLAYVGDHLSYEQDAVATEAYLATARRRISLRRHALLVDYPMHEGCNARAWIHVEVNAPTVALPKAGTRFLTKCIATPRVLSPATQPLREALRQRPLVFEPLHDSTLRAEHNRLSFHAWGDRRCCLPKGATHATLKGHFPNLAEGSFLLFEERLGAGTGAQADADPRHRQVVRLTSVVHSDGAAPLVDPLDQQPVTAIAWAEEDALDFALCISMETDPEHGAAYLEDASIARGNLVLVDHGDTQEAEALAPVPPPRLFHGASACEGRCGGDQPEPVPPRYRPRLARAPLTQAGGVLKAFADGDGLRQRRVAFDPDAPARQAVRWRLAEVWPEISLSSQHLGVTRAWTPRRTLLESAPDDAHFVAELDDEGRAHLRFGDDALGRRPESGTTFDATYRVGNGTAGNVGAEAIAHIVTTAAGIVAVRNPLPAEGGVDPESAESVRRSAPQAFRRQERAVTPEDYAEVAGRFPGVQKAAAALRWTGSWHTVFTTVDLERGGDPTPAQRADLGRHIDRYRMAGHDLEVRPPLHVPIELHLHVCVKAAWFRDDVRRGLLDRLGNRILRDGTSGHFHPDRFSFGDPVYLSGIYAAARAVPGVDSLVVKVFRRLGEKHSPALDSGRIEVSPFEIAQLDNDADHPERGVLRLELHGGK